MIEVQVSAQVCAQPFGVHGRTGVVDNVRLGNLEAPLDGSSGQTNRALGINAHSRETTIKIDVSINDKTAGLQGRALMIGQAGAGELKLSVDGGINQSHRPGVPLALGEEPAIKQSVVVHRQPTGVQGGSGVVSEMGAGELKFSVDGGVDQAQSPSRAVALGGEALIEEDGGIDGDSVSGQAWTIVVVDVSVLGAELTVNGGSDQPKGRFRTRAMNRESIQDKNRFDSEFICVQGRSLLVDQRRPSQIESFSMKVFEVQHRFI
ncbi:hypothetical protein [Kocuria arenosa]|uniref:hypothetical protein n=1 Tax=Kocuria arenosa TaxID=3071446 RepID=UPI0034D52174